MLLSLTFAIPDFEAFAMREIKQLSVQNSELEAQIRGKMLSEGRASRR